ncbi:MAG: DUF4399 domain-containing protein [Paracoccaceae bacterium]|nr:DUF4399 domain-containing protein [Paracoccaceae bacterium]
MKLAAIALTFVALSFPALSQERTPAPEGARAYIISPQNGATVSSPVQVVFGLEGMGVAPAGVEKEKTGHHHLIIDADLPAPNEPVPSDDNYRHFGGGQTQTTVELAPGSHTLQLILGDHNHVPHDPPVVSQKINITVQ